MDVLVKLVNGFQPSTVLAKSFILNLQRHGLKNCQVIASFKFNLRKVHFVLKSRFQVIAFFVPLEVV